MEETAEVEKKNLGVKIALIILAALVITAGALAAYFYFQLGEIRQNPQKVAEVEVQEVIERVGRLIVLPEGEAPTVATVTDPERLKDQPFFARAKVGDRVLIYTNARKAILYNPETNRIVEVAPLNIGNRP